jgi:adenylate cyclase
LVLEFNSKTIKYSMLKKILTSPWTALFTLALVVGLRVADPTFVESVRLRYFDTLVTSKATEVIGVSVVNIDEKALEKYGQFPFSRDIYASIIRDLYRRNAGLVVFNVLTPDRDRMGRDEAYIQTLRQYPTILPNVGSTTTRNQPRNPGSVVVGPYGLDSFVTYPGIVANLPEIENAARGVGIVNTLPEVDGVVRRMPMVVAYNGKLYPSLAMEIMRVAGADSTFQVKVNENGVEKMRIPAFGPVATDSLSRIWIDWSLKPDVYGLTDLPKDFEGEIVIVGVSAQGLSNPVATSLGEMWPQDLQAAVLGTVIANRDRPAITRPDWADGAEIIGIVVLGVLLLFLTRWVYVGLASTVGIVVIAVLGSRFVFSQYSYLLDATLLASGLILVSLHAYGVKFVSEFLQKQAIKKQFAGYASPTVVKLLQENPDLIKKGTKREVSICFSDLRGFTPLGESFGDDVGGLTRVMNGYMDAITQPILEANGMVIKYIGDASMHIHNAPIDDPDHPKTAVAVGLKMVKAVKEYSKQLEAAGRPGVKMGAGINTGLGYIGEMGSTQRHSYDVLGDAVSTTARIESKCKEYGCVLLVGEETVHRCEDDFFFLKIDDLAVKGKSVGVGIYTVLDDVTPEYVMAGMTHDKMHQLYRKQKFDAAIVLCEQLKEEFDGKMVDYYDMWIERCKFQKTQDLPADWNGVFIATSK